MAALDAHNNNGRLFVYMTAGYPLAWAVGLSPMIFVLVALPMVVWLLRNRPLEVPRGTLFFSVFLLMVLASVINVQTVGRLALFVMRASWYTSGLITLIYLARQQGPLARRTIIRGMIALWFLVVIGGYGALVVPTLAWRSPMSMVLPGAIASDEFISALINPKVAEIQEFRWQGVTLYRPAAPFAYTNAWGSSFAMLYPFVLAGFQDRRVGIPRWVLVVITLLGLPPFYYALNRGAWLTLSCGLLFGVLRWAWVTRNLLPIKVLAGLIAITVPLVVTSGVLDTALNQLETRSEDSNETRANIYVETLEASIESPAIGYGTPRTNPANPTGPPLGTHGQLWAIMYAHGFVAIGAYILFFVRGFLWSTGSGPVAHWAKVSLLIGLLQIPIYGHLPLQLFIMVGSAVIASWPHIMDSERPTAVAGSRPPVPVAAGS